MLQMYVLVLLPRQKKTGISWKRTKSTQSCCGLARLCFSARYYDTVSNQAPCNGHQSRPRVDRASTCVSEILPASGRRNCETERNEGGLRCFIGFLCRVPFFCLRSTQHRSSHELARHTCDSSVIILWGFSPLLLCSCLLFGFPPFFLSPTATPRPRVNFFGEPFLTGWTLKLRCKTMGWYCNFASAFCLYWTIAQDASAVLRKRVSSKPMFRLIC